MRCQVVRRVIQNQTNLNPYIHATTLMKALILNIVFLVFIGNTYGRTLYKLIDGCGFEINQLFVLKENLISTNTEIFKNEKLTNSQKRHGSVFLAPPDTNGWGYNLFYIQFCSGTNVILKKSKIDPSRQLETSCIWNTGDTNTSISVNKAGTYWVKRGAYSLNQTKYFILIIDTFYVSEIFNSISKYTDTVFCTNTPIIIGKTDAQKYFWNTTEQTPQISINKPGLYWVIKSNPPCETTDTFNITENPLPVIKSLHDTIICFDQVAKILLDAGNFKSYLWKPTNETSQIIYSSNAQTYLLQVTDNNDCSMSKQITVTENCPQQLFIPNAFSPNEDGINDVFTITTTGLESFEMTIFNRWGEQVFNSQNYLQGWDGKNAPNEVYVLQITYKLKGKPSETVKQNVTLMR